MCRWFGKQLTAIKLAILTNTGNVCVLPFSQWLLTVVIVPLLEEPLRQERETHLHLKDLWLTPLASKHILWSHINRASATSATLTGTPPRNTWIPYQPFKHCEDEDADVDAYSDCAWEDIPEFEASQEMLTDICDEIEEPVVDAVDANWCVSVSAKFFQSFQLVLDGISL